MVDGDDGESEGDGGEGCCGHVSELAGLPLLPPDAESEAHGGPAKRGTECFRQGRRHNVDETKV